jgi:hypothetical protein
MEPEIIVPGYARHTETEVFGFFGRYRFLSNFWFVQIQFEDQVYPTLEHAYQSAKFLDPKIRAEGAARPAKDIKAWSRRRPARSDWEGIKVGVMGDLLEVKFANAGLRALLQATGGRQLVEANHWGDAFWGFDVKQDEGTNHLGRLLMEVRGAAGVLAGPTPKARGAAEQLTWPL